MNEISAARKRQFKNKIWNYYKKHGRHDLPWRHTRDPYKIWISEIMLQQTQVERVKKFYERFVKKFPTVRALAKAPFRDIFKEWRGLGYNRRALFLKRTAEEVVFKHGGKFPKDVSELTRFPGIGINTAGAMAAYSWNRRVLFIETNIRSVFIREFFNKKSGIRDKDILRRAEEVLPVKNPREWYWALTDYGVHVKKTTGNPNMKSAHYARQRPFRGSLREARSRILNTLMRRSFTFCEIKKRNEFSDERMAKTALSALLREGFISRKKDKFLLKK